MKKKESSFCEQKEAKKLHPFAAVNVGRNAKRFRQSRHNQTDKVFLLLFVHKKKTLPSFGTPLCA
jgi:hypothetical protein